MQHVYVKKHTFHHLHWAVGAFNTYLACSQRRHLMIDGIFITLENGLWFVIGKNNKKLNQCTKKKKESSNNTDTLNRFLQAVLNDASDYWLNIVYSAI